MRFKLYGGGFVTAQSCGKMGDGLKPVLVQGDPRLPPAHVVYASPPTRHRRFDDYTRIGCAALSLSLADCGLNQSGEKQDIGMVVGTTYGCFETDLAFWDTAKKDGGQFASPNLFSYTLPGIVMGETAILYRLTGPTLTVGNFAHKRGMDAIYCALDLIAGGSCDTMVAGWLDGPTRALHSTASGDDGLKGGVFVVLSSRKNLPPRNELSQRGGEIYDHRGRPITTILDLFGG